MSDPTPPTRRSPMEHERDAGLDLKPEAVERTAHELESPKSSMRPTVSLARHAAATLRALSARVVELEGALVEAAYIDGFDDGIHESDRRRIRPHDTQTAQEAWATSQSANALAALKGGKDNG